MRQHTYQPHTIWKLLERHQIEMGERLPEYEEAKATNRFKLHLFKDTSLLGLSINEQWYLIKAVPFGISMNTYFVTNVKVMKNYIDEKSYSQMIEEVEEVLNRA